MGSRSEEGASLAVTEEGNRGGDTRMGQCGQGYLIQTMQTAPEVRSGSCARGEVGRARV